MAYLLPWFLWMATLLRRFPVSLSAGNAWDFSTHWLAVVAPGTPCRSSLPLREEDDTLDLEPKSDIDMQPGAKATNGSAATQRQSEKSVRREACYPVVSSRRQPLVALVRIGVTSGKAGFLYRSSRLSMSTLYRFS